MNALKKIFKQKITIVGRKGKTTQKKDEEEEAKKREEDARRLAREAENWLKNEEEERKRATEEAAKKEEERKKKEDAEIKKKQEEIEGLRLTGSKTDQQTTDPIDTQGAHYDIDIGHGQDNPDHQDPAATYGSTQEQVVFSGMNLIPFKQK